MSEVTRRRVARTLLQLLAGGALYGLTEQVAHDVPAVYAPYIVLLYTLLVAVAQNVLEDRTGADLLVRRERPGEAADR